MVTQTLLYPRSRQFPFDETCEEIVRSLEEHNWKVPGFAIRFRSYGQFCIVHEIEGPNFRLHFFRHQGIFEQGNDFAAVAQLNIPGKELHVYENEEGPVLYLYTGKNWEKDGNWFVQSSKSLANFRYLRYVGSDHMGREVRSINKRHLVETESGRWWSSCTYCRPPFLLWDYSVVYSQRRPEVSEHLFYNTEEIFAEFQIWLYEHILTQL